MIIRLFPNIENLCINANICDDSDCVETLNAKLIERQSGIDFSQFEASPELSVTLTSVSLKVEYANTFNTWTMNRCDGSPTDQMSSPRKFLFEHQGDALRGRSQS
jgi:hypothetical protein